MAGTELLLGGVSDVPPPPQLAITITRLRLISRTYALPRRRRITVPAPTKLEFRFDSFGI
jgi:hypothetical protein